MCTCTILSLLRLEINIARTTATTADILKVKNNRLSLYPRRDQCRRHRRKMFAVQTRERPPERRRRRCSRCQSAEVEEDDLAGEQSRKTLSKNLIARNTRAGVSMQGVGFRRPALPISVRAEVRDRDGPRATRQEMRGLSVSRR